MMTTYVRTLTCTALAAVCLVASATAQDKTITQDGIIRGSMVCEFKTRTQLDTTGTYVDGSPQKGVQDVYTLNLTVADTTEYTGRVTRQPELLTKNILSRKQEAQLKYDIDLAVRNPKNLDERKVVGKWAGTAPFDPKTGIYDLAGGVKLESPLRFAINAIGSQTAFTDRFEGRLVGKAQQKDDLTTYTYKRFVGTKTVEIVVKKSDPMRFEDLSLAKGPSPNYPHCVVNGRLDYDYETGNWLTDGIRFRYNLNGKDVEDIVTGSIKWVEDENRRTNGKGFYEFNLRFNEEKNKPATTEAAAFDSLSEEDAFFVVDDSVPCLTGKVSYEDTFIPGGGDEPSPASSKVTFALNANKLTKVQAVNFFKLWMICVGPTNDE
jgi:hypothetical protein